MEHLQEVTSQDNVSHYEVQHSPDGFSFKIIGLVRALNNGAAVQIYSFNLKEAQTGGNYYRIRELDLDGL